MGKLIVVAGNSGVGKTTLADALARHAGYATGLEQQAERPFQALMKQDPRRYGLANQIDYLLYRAEQERALRHGSDIGIIDGGLDLDYYGFTQLFHHKGFLTDAESALCGRLYTQLRAALGPPDLVLRLVAPQDLIERRYKQRGRPLEIAEREDLAVLGQFMDEWLDELPPERCLLLDVSKPGPLGEQETHALIATIRASLLKNA